jgi:DNA repair protein RadD
MVQTGAHGDYERCGYRWTSKDCDACGEANDIAARRCYVCKAEIVDPNERLIAEFVAMKRDPTHPQTDEVISMEMHEAVSQRGNATVRVDWKTPYRQFSTWFMPGATAAKQRRAWTEFQKATGPESANDRPDTISYVKEPDSGFYRILAYNRSIDEAPEGKMPEVKLTFHDGSPVCTSCGGPRSKYSSGVCKACYTAKPDLRVTAARRAA